MPAARESRRRIGVRRNLPLGVTGEAAEASRAASRPARLMERETPYLMGELRRVAAVTATCFGLLIFLYIVDRMQ